MPRNMSFAMTTKQATEKTKDVTRRFGWWNLKEGDIVQQVVKAMGLKKGEKIEKIHLIRIVSTEGVPLNSITKEDVIREGFPEWSTDQFVSFIMRAYKCPADKRINRIEFEYV